MTETANKHNLTTSFLNRLPIEKRALLTENAPELGRMMDAWYGVHQPGMPGECALIEMAVMAFVQRQRVPACVTEMVNQERIALALTATLSVFPKPIWHESSPSRERE
jgi:hypothetical protein